MHAETIASACDLHHLMEAVEVVPGADGDALLLSQTHVITRLLFHAGEDIVFAAQDVEGDGAGRLDVMWTDRGPWTVDRGFAFPRVRL